MFGWNEWLIRTYDQRWTMWRQLLSIFVHVTIIGLVNVYYSGFIFSSGYTEGMSIFERILQELFFAHTVAFMPIVFLISYSEFRLSELYSRQSESISTTSNLGGEILTITINLENGENEISLSSDTFKFAKASGNYVEFFYSENDKIIKDLQRITLSKLEDQIANSSLNVMKTHRSYIVNLDAIEDVKGNAQGYHLSLADVGEKVPVARNKVADFNAVMNG
jgi:LytTr DNA-binding domain